MISHVRGVYSLNCTLTLSVTFDLDRIGNGLIRPISETRDYYKRDLEMGRRGLDCEYSFSHENDIWYCYSN